MWSMSSRRGPVCIGAVPSSLAPYLWAGAVNGGIKIFGVPQAIDLVLIDWKWSWQAG